MKTQRIAAARFKTHCLSLLDEVDKQHVSLIITKRGRPLAKLVPLTKASFSLFGSMQGTLSIRGDIVEGTGEAWDAEKDE